MQIAVLNTTVLLHVCVNSYVRRSMLDSSLHKALEEKFISE